MDELVKKKSEISERIKYLIEFLNVTQNKFATVLGYDRAQTIYDILNGKSAPSFEFFRRLFLSEYSDMINHIWLFTGKESINSRFDIKQIDHHIKCPLCAEKERLIELQDTTIKAFIEVNSILKSKLSGDCYSQTGSG